MFDVQVEQSARARRLDAELLRLAAVDKRADRQVRLHAIGSRFRDGDGRSLPRLEYVRRRLAEDGRCARVGPFTIVRLRLDPQLARVVARVDPLALEGRLAAAARDAIRDRLGWAQGVVYVRSDPGDRSPEAMALLSGRRWDGGPARLLTRTDVQALEASWYARSHDALGVSRELPRPPTPAHLQEWRRDVVSLRSVVGARVVGEATREDFAHALGRFETATSGRMPPRPPEIDDSLAPLRTLHLSIAGNVPRFDALHDPERRDVLRLAVERIGRELGLSGVEAVEWRCPGQSSLHILVYYNDASDGSARAALRDGLTQRLHPALVDAATRYPLPSVGDREAIQGPSRLAGQLAEPTVRFRVEGGAPYLAQFTPDQRIQILQRAAARAFPNAWKEGPGPQLLVRTLGRSIIASVALPARSDAPWPALLPSTETQARFTNEVYRAGAELRGRARDMGSDALTATLTRPGPKATRGVADLVPRVVRERLAVSPLSRAVPMAFRVARGVSRAVGSLLPSREE